MPNKVPRVSVIMPVYNGADFLTNSLSCVCSQMMEDLEIIVVDDGSDDNSLEIIEMFANKDVRIKVIEKEHSGYGDSINRGIEMASGEYIGIVGEYDRTSPTMCAEMYSLAKKTGADIVRCNYSEIKHGVEIVREIALPEESGRAFDPAENTKIFYQTPSVWSGLYRLEFLNTNKIRFMVGDNDTYQDAGFNFKTLAAANVVVLSSKPYLKRHEIKKRDGLNSTETFLVNNEFLETEKYLKSRGLWDSYAKVFQAVKFATYHYNMLALPKRELKPFVLRMRAEFFDAKKRKLLKKSYFPDNHWRVLNMILKQPIGLFIAFFNIYSKDMKKGL